MASPASTPVVSLVMHADPPGRRQIPRLAPAGLLLAVLIVGVCVWLVRRPGTQPRNQAAATGKAALATTAPTPALNASDPKTRDALVYWNAHKARLRQLLTTDYQAALARRDAKFPAVAAVVKFGEEYADNFERRNHEVFPRAEEQDKKYRAKMQEIEAHGHGGLGGDLLLAERWLANTEPVPGGMSVSDLARQFWTDDPNGLAVLRRLTATAERRLSKDEAAAQRVEALQTPQEMADYVRAARVRWEAEQTQVNLEAGYDAQVSEYLLGSQCAAMLSTLTKDYEKRSHAELDAINKESDEILQAMHEPELAAASRDDPEARRLLTELQEFLLLRAGQKNHP